MGGIERGLSRSGRAQQCVSSPELEIRRDLPGESLRLVLVEEPVGAHAPAEQRMFPVDPDDPARSHTPRSENLNDVFSAGLQFHGRMVRRSPDNRNCRNLVVYYEV